MSETLPVIQLDLERAELMSTAELRDLIAELEATLAKYPQVELPVKHHFASGVYSRELPIPKGTLLVGKIHKFHTMNVLSQGELTVISQDGPMRLKAPHTFVSTPGAKRVMFAHEDAVWTCFHATDETDPEKIEEQFIAKTYDDVAQIDCAKSLKIEGA